MSKNFKLKEKQNYHFQMSKKGAYNKNNGKLLSDFERGVHYGKAESILKRRKNYALNQHNKKQKEYEKLFAGI